MPFWMKIECDLEAEFLYLGTGRIRAPLFCGCTELLYIVTVWPELLLYIYLKCGKYLTKNGDLNKMKNDFRIRSVKGIFAD